MNGAKVRIAITGLGMVCPLGASVAQVWPNLLAGKSGIRPVTAFDTSDLEVHNAGEITDFCPDHVLTPAQQASSGRASQLAIVATHEALSQAGLRDQCPYDPYRCGVSFGTTMGEPEIFDRIFDKLLSGGHSAVNPALWSQLPGHNISHRLAHHFRWHGPCQLLPTACAAGNYAIGYAADLLRAGHVDAMVVGGSDALSSLAFVGFHKLRAMAPTHVAPFDLHRKGMMIGEGAATLILERVEDAQARGATIFAEFLSYGLGCDAYKMTIPHPEGAGGIHALRQALAHAGMAPHQLDHISAHGTGTPENDRIETLIIKEVLGDHAAACPVNSIKAMLGHCMGASSAIEALVCCLSLRHGILPPTINYETPDPACDLDYVPVTREVPITTAASHAYAFGGNASAILLKRWED